MAITPTVNDENSELIISKILSRTSKKLIVEHWKISDTYSTGNLILEKCLGCKHNQNRAYEGCEKLYYEKEILGSLSGFIRKRGNSWRLEIPVDAIEFAYKGKTRISKEESQLVNIVSHSLDTEMIQKQDISPKLKDYLVK